MSRRLAAVALVAAAIAVPMTQQANAATCGIVIDYVVSHYAPPAVWPVYTIVCGV